MMKFEDVPIELVDMPPITAEIVMPGQVGTYRNCDLIAIMIDLSADIEEQWKVCLDFLETETLCLSKKLFASAPRVILQRMVLSIRLNSYVLTALR